MAGYAGYDPERDRLARRREIVDTLQQNAMQMGPKSLGEGLSQIGQALIARYAGKKADREEQAYGDNKRKIADALMGQMFPGSNQVMSADLNSDRPVSLTPEGYADRDARGGLGDQVRTMASLTDDPMQAIQFGIGAQQAQAETARNEQERNAPKFFNTGQGIVAVRPDESANLIYGSEADAPTQDLPPGMMYGADGKPTEVPGYVDMYRRMHPQASASQGDMYRDATPAEMEAKGYPKGTVGQINLRTKEVEVKSRPSSQQTGQPTEGERNAGLHATISLNGLQNLMSMEGSGYNRADTVNQMWGAVGGERERLYDQAADEFVDGYLRAMTGAAATKDEVSNYKRQWFPQFGDNEKVIKQKSLGRLNALKGMKSKAGRAWKPEWDQVIGSLEKQLGVAPSAGDPAPTDPNARSGGWKPNPMWSGQLQLGAQPQPHDDDIDPGIAQAINDGFGPDDEDADEVPDGWDPQDWDALDPEDRAAVWAGRRSQ